MTVIVPVCIVTHIMAEKSGMYKIGGTTTLTYSGTNLSYLQIMTFKLLVIDTLNNFKIHY